MEKVFIAWSFTSGPVAWTGYGCDLDNLREFIAENDEDLAIMEIMAKDSSFESIMGLSENDVKFALFIENPNRAGRGRGYYEASAICGDYEFGLEWDILDSIDTTGDYDEKFCCDWKNPRAIYGSPTLSLDKIEVEWY